MNKTHKAIAGIIKEHYKDIVDKSRLRKLANKLADNFEREDKCQNCGISKGEHFTTRVCKGHEPDFNPREFKKLCGVE